MSVALINTKAVTYFDEIIIIGGENEGLSDIVHVLNVNPGSVTVMVDSLPYAVSDVSILVVGNTVYGFGGESADELDANGTIATSTTVDLTFPL